MKWALGLALAASVVCLAAAQVIVTIPKNQVTAPTCSSSDVQTAFNAVTAGGTVNIAPGICHWTTSVTWAAPADVTVLGAGNTNIGGGDATVIVDDYASGSPLLTITANPNGTFRLSAMTLRGGTGLLKESGIVVLNGPAQTRIDHVHFDMTTYSPLIGGAKPIWFANGVFGVLDHSLMDFYQVSAFYFFNGSGSSGAGDEAWAAPTAFGSSDRYFFIEDNKFTGTAASPVRIGDSFSGSRVVWRFNTLQGSAGLEQHATGHSTDGRGARSQEGYGNHLTVTVGASSPVFDLADLGGGTALIWGNTADTDAVIHVMSFNVTRKNDDTYPQPGTPDNFGYCGPPPVTGTVNVAANGVDVTKASGTNFDTAWPSGSMFYIAGASCSSGVVSSQPYGCIISSVASISALTLSTSTGGTLTGAAYSTGSGWDGNTDVRGYPCIDQIGRGQGDLLTGVFPTKVNSTTGTLAWPNQALEPVYFWNNTASPAGGYGGSFYRDNTGGRIVADRDYYAQASGVQTNATTPFNGTTGTGWGTLANRPTTCTAGVGYFATDQGNWNTSTLNPEGVQQNGADGQLFLCTAANTWTLFYTPAIYPHPLNR